MVDDGRFTLDHYVTFMEMEWQMRRAMAEGETLTQVEFGSQVEVELIDQEGGRERLIVVIVSDEMADLDKGLLGEQTPLAKAILGRPVGRMVPYRVGELTQVKICRARRIAPPATGEGAARRQAVLQKALDDAERTNAEMFAASYSGKWGDYAAKSETDWQEGPPPPE
jgi:hypothetical protein